VGGVASLLCCEDYSRVTLEPGAIRKDAQIIRQRTGVCAKCSQEAGGDWRGWHCYQPLEKSRYWPPRLTAKTAPAVTSRLVVLPVSNAWVNHAAALLDTIDACSHVPGKSLVLWNGDGPCPEVLCGPTRIIREYPPMTGPHPNHPNMSLGWTAINRLIGEAFKYTLDKGFEWAIKLDTDTAVLRKGWDAALLAGGQQGEARGFYLEEGVYQWAQQPLDTGGGIFTPDMQAALKAGSLRWAKGYLDAGWHKGSHLQGGCYAVSREALRRMRDTGVGLVPDEAEQLIGEDILFSLRCRVAGVPQRHSGAVVSHYFPAGSYHPSVARYYRDACRASVIHPIKDLEIFQDLCREAAQCE
jgi:hypothetical protein